MSSIARCCTAVLLGLPALVFAHHANVEYDDSQLVEVQGEVLSVSWRNPHVGFVVNSGDADAWEVEGSSVNRLERLGVESEMFEVGDRVTFLGFASRRGQRRLLPVYATLPNGREVVMTLAPAKNFGLVDENAQANVTVTGAMVELATSQARGIFRVWTFSSRSGGNASLPLTASARAETASWVEPEDQAWGCEPPGMIENMLNPYPIEFIDSGTEIALRLEQWEVVRTIHMDRSVNVGDRPAARMGYSVGYWEGRTLVVQTTDIDNPYFDDLGTPQSEAVEITERFTLSEDGTRLDWVATVIDPEVFTEPVIPQNMHWIWVPGEEVKPFDCAVPTQL